MQYQEKIKQKKKKLQKQAKEFEDGARFVIRTCFGPVASP